MVPKVWPLDQAQSSTPRTRFLDSADQRVRAERHPEPSHQTLAGTSSQGTSHHGDDLAGSLGLSRVGSTNLGEMLGKNLPLATSITATPATDMQPEDYRSALDRKVF